MTHLKGGKRRIKDSEDDESGSESESGSGGEESDLEAESDPAQEQGGLKSFEDNREECKLVLVVRTDLGMSKGTPEHLPSPSPIALNDSHPLHPPSTHPPTHLTPTHPHRQNRRPMRPRHPRLLHAPPRPRPRVPAPPPLGSDGPGEDRAPGGRRGAGGAAAAEGGRGGVVRKGRVRCGEDAGGEGERDGAGGGAGAEGGRGWGYGGVEVVVGWGGSVLRDGWRGEGVETGGLKSTIPQKLCSTGSDS